MRTAGEGVARFIGGRPLDFEGQSAAALFTEESWKAALPRLVDPEERGEGFSVEMELLRAAQAPLAVRASVVDIAYPVDGILVSIEELAEEEDEGPSLEEQIAHLRGVLDGLGDGVLVISGGQVVEANPTARAWLGSAVVDAPFRDLLPAEDLLRALDRVARAEGGETVEAFECWLVPVDSALRPKRVEVAVTPFRRDDAPAAVITARNLSFESVSPRRYLENQARLLAILETVTDGFVLLAPPSGEGEPWQVSLSNPRTSELLGLDTHVALGFSEDELRALVAHRFKDPSAFATFLDRSIAEPAAEHVRGFELAGGIVRNVELSARPVHAEAGALIGRVLVIRDITRHKEVERRLSSDAAELDPSRGSLQKAYEDLSRMHRELEKKSTEIVRANRELRELDEARAQLLANVSHELQTPLVSIRGYTQMVIEGRLGSVNDEQRRGLEVAIRNVDRMVELISNLLALARSEQERPLEAVELDPEPLLVEVFERHRESAARLRVQLEQHFTPGELTLRAERDGLIQVLDNLIGNAIKFNRPGGRVAVGLKKGPDGFALLDVTDTGIGIPEGEQRRIFERFYRGRAAAQVQGTGIGLATVRHIVERHGGRIELSSVPEQGSSFRVYWPMPDAKPSSAGQESPAAAS